MISKFNCLSIAAAATFLCVTSAFAQDNRGTPEQRAACAPDAFRLCARATLLTPPGSNSA